MFGLAAGFGISLQIRPGSTDLSREPSVGSRTSAPDRLERPRTRGIPEISGMRSRPTGPRRPGLRARLRSCLPRIEVLEDRMVLANFIVTTPLDTGTGSLRQAILNSNASVGVADTIT